MNKKNQSLCDKGGDGTIYQHGPQKFLISFITQKAKYYPFSTQSKNEHTTLVWKLNSISLLFLFLLFSLFCSFIMMYLGVNIFFAYHCWDLVSLLNMKIGGFY